MKITVTVPRSGPSVEPELLVRFVIKKCREVTEPPAVWVALALAAVADDLKFYNRFREVISSSSASADKILGMSDTLFMPALGRFHYEYLSDCPSEQPKYLFPHERTCRSVLRQALSEGKKMLAQKTYESMKGIFQVLTRAGLQCYSFRLAQFDDICESFRDDPENLVRQGIEIIEVVTVSPTNEN